MLKKIILGIVALLLLVGAENLLATEKKDKPKAKQQQEQVQKGQKKQTSKAKAAAVARKRMEARRGKPQQLRPGQARPMQEGAGRLLDELTKAYRENDREKMGQLIRKMHQFRQKVRKAMGVPGEAGRDFRGSPGPAMPFESRRPRAVEKPRPPIPRTDEDWPRMQPPKDMARPLMPGRGTRGWGQGFQGRGMGGWGRGLQGRGMRGSGQGFRGRGMGGWGRGFQGRGMGGWGRGFRGRGIGGRGRGFPAPWCPWLQDPVPEMD